MFEVMNVDVSYGRVQVLWDVSLNVKEREIVSVLGPNGAGKSTLLLSAVGLVRSKKGKGSITYCGQRIDGMPPEQIIRLGIAIVTEDKHLFPDMSVLDNLKMGSHIERAKKKRNETLGWVFELFPRLEERKDQMTHLLSGGEKQMVAIGRALMSCPDFLMIDEPSIGLQPSLISKTFDVIQEIRSNGVTILLIEQNVYFSLETSDRAYVIENGRIVMEGRGQELLQDSHIKKAYLAL